MAYLRRLLLFGYPLLEIVTFLAFVNWLGWGWALLISFIGIPIGWVVFRNAGRRALQAARKASAPSRSTTFQMLSGVLLMIPGFWTDVAALALFIPPLQAKLAAPFTNISTSTGAMNWRVRTWAGSGDIVEGVVIREHDDPFNHRPIERDD